jgi:hypothetical protein
MRHRAPVAVVAMVLLGACADDPNVKLEPPKGSGVNDTIAVELGDDWSLTVYSSCDSCGRLYATD